jgi:hypothetical protein
MSPDMVRYFYSLGYSVREIAWYFGEMPETIVYILTGGRA